MWSMIKKWIPALKSRKVRISIATFVVATAAKWGLDLDTELVYAVVVLGVALITGIAIEDHGVKSAKRTLLTSTLAQALVKGNGQE